jgi:hypothetical protein
MWHWVARNLVPKRLMSWVMVVATVRYESAHPTEAMPEITVFDVQRWLVKGAK